jgi:release factor glutamine methyltransferase
MSVQAGLRAGAARLGAAGISEGAREARLLMAAALGLDPSRMTLHLHDDLDPEGAARFEALVARRAAREPMSHILGQRQFYGRAFKVTGDVLDPRPETECLVAAALEEGFERVLDLGTGSGCILLSLLAEREGAQGLGADVSAAALDVARENAARLGLASRAAFQEADWFKGIAGQYDLIVSNPPYIGIAEMPELAPELAHEPRAALTDEGDGLSAYRAIAAGVSAHLVPGGRILVEIGRTQGAEVARIFAEAGLQAVELRQDLDGRDRVVMARSA